METMLYIQKLEMKYVHKYKLRKVNASTKEAALYFRMVVADHEHKLQLVGPIWAPLPWGVISAYSSETREPAGYILWKNS